MNGKEALKHHIQTVLDNSNTRKHQNPVRISREEKSRLRSMIYRIDITKEARITEILLKAGYTCKKKEDVWTAPGADREYVFVFPFQGRIMCQSVISNSQDGACIDICAEFLGLSDNIIVYLEDPTPSSIIDAVNQIIAEHSFT